jgi:hypothetical protein
MGKVKKTRSRMKNSVALFCEVMEAVVGVDQLYDIDPDSKIATIAHWYDMYLIWALRHGEKVHDQHEVQNILRQNRTGGVMNSTVVSIGTRGRSPTTHKTKSFERVTACQFSNASSRYFC